MGHTQFSKFQDGETVFYLEDSRDSVSSELGSLLQTVIAHHDYGCYVKDYTLFQTIKEGKVEVTHNDNDAIRNNYIPPFSYAVGGRRFSYWELFATREEAREALKNNYLACFKDRFCHIIKLLEFGLVNIDVLESKRREIEKELGV